MIDPRTIGEDDPVPLDVAVSIFLPHAGITRHTLLAEISKGRLEYDKVGRRILVTRRQIEEMRERCRVSAKEPDSTSANAKIVKRSGSSLTERMKKAQASARAISQRLKSGYTNISPESGQMNDAKVIQLKRP